MGLLSLGAMVAAAYTTYNAWKATYAGIKSSFNKSSLASLTGYSISSIDQMSTSTASTTKYSQGSKFEALSPVDINILTGGTRSVNGGSVKFPTRDEFYSYHALQHKSNTIDSERYEKFNRFGRIFLEDEADMYIHYIFMVRPSLNLTGTTRSSPNRYVKNDPVLWGLWADNKYNLMALTSDFSYNHDFIPILVGRCNSMPTTDYEIKTYDVSQLNTPFKYIAGGKGDESQTSVNFTMEFLDNKNMDILKMFYAWTYYISKVSNGEIFASDYNRHNKIADYFTSIYDIMTDATGQKIVYFAKVTGAIPVGVPFSDLSFQRGQMTDSKRSISFQASYVESLNPIIINEFNYNAHLIKNIQSTSGSSYSMGRNDENTFYGTSAGKPSTSSAASIIAKSAPMYNANVFTGDALTGAPFIYGRKDGNNWNYYLSWLASNDD